MGSVSNHGRFWRVPIRERLMAQCETREGCWEWIGARQSNGYGKVYRSGKNMGAHRASYEAFVGPIPTGMMVLHSCDNRACVNPGHLHLGDAKMNAKEASSRGRSAFGERNGAYTKPESRPRGANNGMVKHPESRRCGAEHWCARTPERIPSGPDAGAAKLTEDQVAAIVMRVAAGETRTSVASEYGVHRSTVGYIVAGKRWRSGRDRRGAR